MGKIKNSPRTQNITSFRDKLQVTSFSLPPLPIPLLSSLGYFAWNKRQKRRNFSVFPPEGNYVVRKYLSGNINPFKPPPSPLLFQSSVSYSRQFSTFARNAFSHEIFSAQLVTSRSEFVFFFVLHYPPHAFVFRCFISSRIELKFYYVFYIIFQRRGRRIS